jgi:hypothetical protein
LDERDTPPLNESELWNYEYKSFIVYRVGNCNSASFNITNDIRLLRFIIEYLSLCDFNRMLSKLLERCPTIAKAGLRRAIKQTRRNW